METNANTMWTTGYFGDFRVSFTVDLANMQAFVDATGNVARIIEALQAAGVTATLAGLEAGEETMTIDLVGQRKWRGSDGKDKHAIDMYTNFLQWKLFTVYIDEEEDKEAFESASGLKLDKMPLIQGAGATDKQDDRLVKTAFDVVYKQSTTPEGKRSDKFVRYANQASTPATPSAPASNGNGNGSKPETTEDVTLQAALYITHNDGVRTYYVKDINDNKYWTPRGSLIEFASENPGKLDTDTAHKILGLGGAIATVNPKTKEVKDIKAEAVTEDAIAF